MFDKNKLEIPVLTDEQREFADKAFKAHEELLREQAEYESKIIEESTIPNYERKAMERISDFHESISKLTSISEKLEIQIKDNRSSSKWAITATIFAGISAIVGIITFYIQL